MDSLEKLHFNAKAIRTTTEELTPGLTYPAIAQIRTEEGLNHFVVIHKVTKKGQITIANPAKGIEKLEGKGIDVGLRYTAGGIPYGVSISVK